ncbi:hypothetical protein EQO05_06995 [Methanosarcina sp. MSH10X1]|uniref:hypothetical protein n=1 Tax=Methanosarcina sp. MSH10X1 TaxID=2507075 RepID=UPI000FFCB5D6|nr:hypothetical protein [Methanosarcina sp. MSH10X1]RXA19891.1 hypothetical protein EQO05_06995 [Methanosarcina sp. MSH10X1]
MSDEYYRSHKDHSTETKNIELEYSSGKDEIPIIDETIPSTSTKGEENKYSTGKPRRVIIRARINND